MSVCPMGPMLASNLRSPCFNLLSIGILSEYHYVWWVAEDLPPGNIKHIEQLYPIMFRAKVIMASSPKTQGSRSHHQ